MREIKTVRVIALDEDGEPVETWEADARHSIDFLMSVMRYIDRYNRKREA